MLCRVATLYLFIRKELFAQMRLAVIDIGSNTIKMTVFDAKESQTAIYSKTVHARLSAHVSDGYLSRNGIRTLVCAVNALKRDARAYRCKRQNIYAFATACIREAKNREIVLRIAERSTKMKIDLLSGEREGEICFIGALCSGRCPQNGVLADLGGGSCEFISFENGNITDKISLSIGAVANYRKFVSGDYITPSELSKLLKHLGDETSPIGDRIKMPIGGEMILTGGSARATVNIVSALRSDSATLPYTLKLCEIEDLCQKSASGELRDLVEKIAKERAKALPCGVAVFCIAAKALGKDTLTVVSGGAREGYAQTLINKRKKEFKIYGNKRK